MELVSVAVIGYLSLYVVFVVVNVVVFIQRKHLAPLKFRYQKLFYVSTLGSIACATLSGVLTVSKGESRSDDADSRFCWINAWGMALFFSFVAGPTLIESFRLYRYNQSTKQMLNRADSDLNYLKANRTVEREKYLFRMCWLFAGPHLVAAALFTFILDFRLDRHESVCYNTNVYTIISSLVFLFCSAYMIFKLRNIEEHMNFRRQLIGFVANWMVAFSVYLGLNLSSLDSPLSPDIALHIGLLCSSLIIHSWFIFLSFDFESRERVQSDISLCYPELSEISAEFENLNQLLADTQGHEAFRDFLIQEFSVENLLFYTDVKAYIAQCEIDSTSEDCALLAMDIFSKYIPSDAPMAVNITHTTLTKTEELLRTAAERCDFNGIFDKARDEIYTLMVTDSFPRFRTGPLFQNLCREVQKIRAVAGSSRRRGGVLKKTWNSQGREPLIALEMMDLSDQKRDR